MTSGTTSFSISDGAPLLYDEDENDQIVKAGYDIRTDRFDIALMGRNAIERSKLAKKDGVHATDNNDTPENNATADDAA